MTPEHFSARFRVDVRVNHEVVAIDRTAKTVTVRSPDGTERRESYDKLLLATGSSPLVPPLPGVDHPRVFRLWTLPDLDSLMAAVEGGARRALVIGGGFIGLETAENLARRGVAVTVVELLDQILPTMDREMTAPLAVELSRLGVGLELGRKVLSFRPDAEGLAAALADGRELAADLAVMAVGVRPNSELARAAGLALGPRGHIVVDEALRTSDPDIHAAGDVVEVADPVLGGSAAIPLAGPANKQGRLAADAIAGRAVRYRGSYGAAVIQVGELAAAGVGATERRLKAAGADYRKIYLHPASNASYYPGGARLHMKLLFSAEGKILGCQAVGAKGADTRIDVVAAAMRAGVDARGLAELELAYAPPFNSAKDPVNLAGMIASNVLDGDSRVAQADALPEGARLLDVREPDEFAAGTIPGAVNIPLESLRDRLAELDPAAPITVFCQVGLRGYVAERILRQRGFDASNLSGGYTTWKLHNPG
jgi:NADPH-dependent 2,4-dienoyl-CoA reductase/sulfur reductase-like enzyme/rhodanese-related sulfurtransferase